jgi:hypothetical protein
MLRPQSGRRPPPYPLLPASSSNRVTAAVADEGPVPSRVTSPWTGGSRTHGERGVSKVTTRHDQHSIRREQRLEPQTVRQRLPGPNRQVQLAPLSAFMT